MLEEAKKKNTKKVNPYKTYVDTFVYIRYLDEISRILTESWEELDIEGIPPNTLYIKMLQKNMRFLKCIVNIKINKRMPPVIRTME